MEFLKYFNFFLVLSFLQIYSITPNNTKELMTSFIELDSSTIINPLDNSSVQGKMEINGELYNAVCDCNPVHPFSNDRINPNLANECNPTKTEIKLEINGQGATAQDIRDLIGKTEDLGFVYVNQTSFQCVDGRNTRAGIYTPGGDAGEFIIALMVYEDLIGGGKRLSQKEIDSIFSIYLRNMNQNKFYMCSDDIAVSHLEKELLVKIFI